VRKEIGKRKKLKKKFEQGRNDKGKTRSARSVQTSIKNIVSCC